MPQYVILSTYVVIASYSHIFLSFQDGDTLHNSSIKHSLFS
jgi:hypothetical protein